VWHGALYWTDLNEVAWERCIMAWRWLARGLVAAGICSFVCFAILEYWFVTTAPNTPVSGATHAIKWRTATIYLTDAQQLATDSLFWGGILLSLAAVAANLMFKAVSQRERIGL
jgi:hypothetical protein